MSNAKQCNHLEYIVIYSLPLISNQTSTQSIKVDKEIETQTNKLTPRNSDIVTPLQPKKVQMDYKERFRNQHLISDSHPAPNFDAELKSMQLSLQESYELFQNISNKFDSVNFGGLKSRIKDLNLSKRTSGAGFTSSSCDLNNVLEPNFVQNQLGRLTNEMGGKFKNHPGEFGDIPELSCFFQACTQLQHGLDQLKRHRLDVVHLENSIVGATEATYDRMDEIRKSMEENTMEKQQNK